MDTNDRTYPEDKKDTWSEKMCIKLIKLYQTHPVLYDPKDPFFYKRYAKLYAWNTIGEALKKSPIECKHKMNILLSSFRRQKSKFKKGNMTVSKWFAYKYMRFLLLINKEEHEMYKVLANDSDDAEDNTIQKANNTNNRVMTAEGSDERMPSEIQSPEDSNDIETLIVTEDDFIKMENDTDVDDDVDVDYEKEPGLISNIISRPLNQTTEDTEIPGPSQYPQPDTEILMEEEINAFTNFIQKKMKKYSPKTVNFVQQEICQILFKADQELLEN